MNATSLQTFSLLAPEIALVVAALVAYLGGVFLGLRWGWLVAGAGIVAAMAVTRGQAADAAFSAGVSVDAFSGFVRWSVLTLGLLLVLVQAGDLFASAVSRGPGIRRGGTCEEAGTFLLLLAGLSLVGVAGDLVLLFAGLELVSIPTYILLGLKRTDAHGQEASLKYFFLSLVASAVFLYAVVCLYGIGGSTDLQAIAARLRSPDAATDRTVQALLPLAVGMAIVGAAFRLAAVPMHFYAPDVYEGTSPGNAAMLSTLPKVAGVVVLARLVSLVGPAVAPEYLWRVAVVLAAVTMTVGNVMALWQRNLRRLLACSSIAHAGYLLVGIAVAAAVSGNPRDADAKASWLFAAGGLSATLFYLATYGIATIGLFGAIAYLGHRWPEWTSGGPRPPREEIATVDDLDGLSSTNPVVAFAITVFLLSLAGIPPLPGFWGKLSLAVSTLEVDWNAAITAGSRRAWFVGLAVVLVLNAAIAAAYYLRIIAAMYFKTTKRGVQADGGLAAGVAMLVCLSLVGAVTLRPRGLFTAASRAGETVVPAPQALAPAAAGPSTPLTVAR
jgi:NADH-quinone oxidoreductase subunit N